MKSIMPFDPDTCIECGRHGYVMEHIVVFENETGIAVQPNCVVHHLNGNKQDNRIENLCLMSFSAHTTYHNNKRWGNNK